MTVQIGLFLKSTHSDGCSTILYCFFQNDSNSHHYAELLTSFSGYRKRLPNLVNASWLSRFKPSRNGEIFWILNNKWAYLRWILFTSASSNGRILPDKNTNALSPSSPGIISFIEMPSANVTSLFSRSCITSCLRWAEQQIRDKMFGIFGRK